MIRFLFFLFVAISLFPAYAQEMALKREATKGDFNVYALKNGEIGDSVGFFSPTKIIRGGLWETKTKSGVGVVAWERKADTVCVRRAGFKFGVFVEKRVTPPATIVEPGRATQCKATTKKGARCKRMTTDAGGYCWQHK